MTHRHVTSFHPKPPKGFDPLDVMPPPLEDRLRGVSSLALDVSGSCNLACRYCAENASLPRRKPMTAESLRAAWRFLFPDGKPRPNVSLRFGSGEPLLNLSLLTKLHDILREAADQTPAVFLTTNGTLINDELADWLAASGWYVKVSLDGPAAVHDRWRVKPGGLPTHAEVAAAVTRLSRRMADRLSVTAVLCRDNDPAAVFEAVAGLGVRRIELVPAVHRDAQVCPGPEDIKRYEKFVEKHARELSSAKSPDMPLLIRFANRVARVMGYGNLRVQCDAGRTFFGVGPDGDLYPCFRFIGLDQYRLGHVQTGIDTEKAEDFWEGAGRSWERRDPCRQCWAAPLCGGPCFSCAEIFGEGKPLPVHCEYVLADSRAAVRLVSKLQKRDPERLLPFIPADLKKQWLVD